MQIGDMTLNVAVAHGTANARELLERIKRGEKQYHFVEVMGCPGGCVTGGGQPIVPSWVRLTKDPRVERAKALYNLDKAMPIRRSHENPEVLAAYRDFLGKPGGHKSHELLHTHYKRRPKYQPK